MMAKYSMKAETGKFESRLKGQEPEPKRIAAGDVVIGVVQMHEAMIHMIQALQDSNLFLEAINNLRALDEDIDQINWSGVEQVIQANHAALGQIELDK